MRLRLRIEPIPASTWGLSLASRLPKEEWDKIRYEVYRDADYQCEICESVNKTLHCHERWTFDDKKFIQRLVGFECCCELCHDVHHFGRSRATRSHSYIDRLIGHWCKVNKKTRKDFVIYEKEISLLNRKRADRQYIVKVGRRILV